jgi:CHAD domain-containing protein
MQMVVEKLLPELFDVQMIIHYGGVRLAKHDTVGESFRLVMANIIDHLRNNISEARGGEVAGIHQLRIGIRRARSALRFYQPLLPPNKVRRFDRRLHRFGLIFGAARDWDVFLMETFDSTWPEAEEIRLRATQQQGYHHDHVSAVLRQPQFSNLLDRMYDWSQSVQLPEEPIRKVAPELLDRMVEQVKKRQRKAKHGDARSLHRLRRSIKRLRYACEFVAEIFPGKAVKRYAKMLKASQDRLGKYNDTIVTEGLLFKIGMHVPLRKVLEERQKATRPHAKGPSGLRTKRFW